MAEPEPSKGKRWVIALELEGLKFSAAHFVAFHGFREPMHGHNYTVGARIGARQLQPDGYVIDFGDVKKVLRQICKRLNQRTLLPARSDVLTLQQLNDLQLEVQCQGGVKFVLPAADCLLLPIVHSTAEELAEYIALEVVQQLGHQLRSRLCQWLEVSVSERPGQTGCFTIPLAEAASFIHVRGSPTPRPCMVPVSGFDPMDQVQLIPSPPVSQVSSDPAEDAYRLLLSTLGIAESSRHELDKTPARAAKAFREMTAGLRVEDPLSVVGDAVFEVDGAYDLVAVRDIPFHSLCEHHLLPFAGTAHIAYFPNGRVLGLSKFARLLEVFARRLQLQERLGHQLAEALNQLLSPKAVAVSLEAYHTCMSHRGASVPSTTRTIALRGVHKDDPSIRDQLLSGVSRSGHLALGPSARL